MVGLGGVLVVVGLALAIGGFAYDPGVDSGLLGTGRIFNLSRGLERQMLVIAGLAIGLAGTIFLAAGSLLQAITDLGRDLRQAGPAPGVAAVEPPAAAVGMRPKGSRKFVADETVRHPQLGRGVTVGEEGALGVPVRFEYGIARRVVPAFTLERVEAPPPEEPALQLEPGARVDHQRYGEGVVTRVDELAVAVDFDRAGPQLVGRQGLRIVAATPDAA